MRRTEAPLGLLQRQLVGVAACDVLAHGEDDLLFGAALGAQQQPLPYAITRGDTELEVAGLGPGLGEPGRLGQRALAVFGMDELFVGPGQEAAPRPGDALDVAV